MIPTAQKMKFSINDFFSKCEKSFLRIWLHLLKKSLMENFIFNAASMFICLSSLHILFELYELQCINLKKHVVDPGKRLRLLFCENSWRL